MPKCELDEEKESFCGKIRRAPAEQFIGKTKRKRQESRYFAKEIHTNYKLLEDEHKDWLFENGDGKIYNTGENLCKNMALDSDECSLRKDILDKILELRREYVYLLKDRWWDCDCWRVNHQGRRHALGRANSSLQRAINEFKKSKEETTTKSQAKGTTRRRKTHRRKTHRRKTHRKRKYRRTRRRKV